MESKTVIYIIICLLVSIVLSYFQYYYKAKSSSKSTLFLSVLKGLTIFLIGILLINPKVTSTTIENVKPVLSVILDNSLSIKHFKEKLSVKNIVSELKSSSLGSKFDVNFYKFGKEVGLLDSLDFKSSNTNINKALTTIEKLTKNTLSTSILVTDGNQTIGNDYEYTNLTKKVFPVIVGDTTTYSDLRITQLNVNKFSYLNNKFPAEVFLYYDGVKNVNTKFTITHKNKVIFSKNINFSKDKKSHTITTHFSSDKKGVQYYTAQISRLKNEKNVKNNRKSFAVEVLNEQSKVLILAGVIHPDIGMLKRSIEKNKQRKVDISLASNFKGSISDYQLVILYQPNNYFNKYITNSSTNFVLITGAKTDWNFVNNLKLGFNKKYIRQTEKFTGSYNHNFTTFLQKDINFNSFPPLTDFFGQISLNSDLQVLLYQKVSGIITQQPLVATFDDSSKKYAVIFGEGLWKWRVNSYVENEEFNSFDEFINNIAQYVSSSKIRKRLVVDVERQYPANAKIEFTALYLDKNYKFDNRATLQLKLTEVNSKKTFTYPLSLHTNNYKTVLEGLPSGIYKYVVSVGGQNNTVYGQFKVTEFQIEEQFTNANYQKLDVLASKTKGKLFFKNQLADLKKYLLNDKTYYTVQKEYQSTKDLINWKFLLFVIVLLLSVEWFYRKYIGKI